MKIFLVALPLAFGLATGQPWLMALGLLVAVWLIVRMPNKTSWQ